MIKQSLLVVVLFVSSSFGSQFEVPQNNVMASHKLGAIKLYHANDSFAVESNGKQYKVQKHWMSPELRKISPKQLNAFLDAGYIDISQMDNQEYALKAKVRGLGGGPVCGVIAYWTVKGGAYLGICAGTAVAVGAAAGTLPITGPLAGAAGGLATTTMAIAAPAGTTATIIAGTAGATSTLAGTAIAGGIQATATLAATAAAIESASIGAGVFFGSMPFLP